MGGEYQATASSAAATLSLSSSARAKRAAKPIDLKFACSDLNGRFAALVGSGKGTGWLAILRRTTGAALFFGWAW
ncbi:hypothetical protein [Streptomyces sp. NPDC057694]|uniref:hypothetical protein n=1 Tax=Streptomyces sp. NPDC057694 TaxID=3346216 RepID=UPI0036C66975